MFSILISMGMGITIGYALNCYSNSIQMLFDLFKHSPKQKHLPEWTKNIYAGLKVCQAGFDLILARSEQFFNHTCIKRGSFYHIKFFIGNKLYIIVVKPPRGPKANLDLNLYDENLKNCNSKLAPYIRGLQSRVELTPQILGLECLSIIHANGECHDFTSAQPIQITDV